MKITAGIAEMDTANPVAPNSPLRQRDYWIILATLTGGVSLPIAGTLILRSRFSGWSRASLPIHSTFEVVGAVIGLTLAMMILFSHQKICTLRRCSIVCALISMAVFDIAHSCVSPGPAFIWLHSIAILSGGIFFATAWVPEREISRNRAIVSAMTVLVVAILISAGSLLNTHLIPAMTTPEGSFSPLAAAINLSGGLLTILGGIAFTTAYHRTSELEDLVFLFLCILFGSSALLFLYSDIWQAGWWFWHVTRLGGYLLPFWLAVFAYRLEEEKNLQTQSRLALAIAKGDFTQDLRPRHAYDELGNALHEMTVTLRNNRHEFEKLDWLKTSLSRLGDALRGDPDEETLASRVITEITTRIGAPIGAFYIADNQDQSLSLFGSYAFYTRKNLSNRFKSGEGLVGQAARDKQQIFLKNVPEDYIKISSQLSECTPCFICVTPFMHEGRVKGVIEIGTLRELSPLQLDYLSKTGNALGLAVESAQGRSLLAQSLNQSQALAEKLQTQQEELKSANEELEEKTKYLERQQQDLMRTSQALEQKADELARSSKYKSEFLANMSHELRTPLNSLLILADSLAENSSGNLTENQIESAEVMLGSGKALLSLINEILDLSKIEAGQMDLHIAPVSIQKLADDIHRGFKHMFEQKGLSFETVIEETVPTVINSDAKRIGQILKNLISNAGKFTAEGSITLTFSSGVLRGNPCLVFAVKDTGLGIPPDKQKIIFEAFQQADGSTARRYGGTGLGLSISKELARILGGEIRLESQEGRGSVFSVLLPLDVVREAAAPVTASTAERLPVTSFDTPIPAYGSVSDDRNELEDRNPYILIIEDDKVFAGVLLQQCHDKGLKGMVASNGEEGLHLVEKQRPSAVILDLKLPGINGWSVLDQLKNNVQTRHIPVHVMSAEDPTQNALSRGAIGFLTKPVEKLDLDNAFDRIEDVIQRKMKDLLVIEDDDSLRKAIMQLIGNGDVKSVGVGTGKRSLEILKEKKFDCVILDLNLPDMSGFELLEMAENDEAIVLPPVIVYTGRELTRDEEANLAKYSESIIVKGVRSRERLFDEASLFLHRVVETMPEKKRQMITNLHDTDHMFKDKTVLIVDDDMRNLFALSNALSGKGMKTIKAQDGQKALDALKAHPEINLVLMDIMMPVMDGYEAMARIRSEKRFDLLPVIALTAKAMKDDRHKCLEAGANDYLAKPVDIDRLFSLMRVWMYR